MSIKNRVQSFRYAFRGLYVLFATQANARIHLLALILVMVIGLFFRIQPLEWAILGGAMALVLAMEAMNTALEFLTDLVSPNYHILAEKAKDVAAAAVLISAIGAVVSGLFILGPYLLHWFFSLSFS